jgi:predicted negative regulator of RcsB-dependent stress response
MSNEKIDFTSQIMIWVSKNIKYVIVGAVAGITIPLSWNYYQYNIERNNLVASDLYNELSSLVNTNDDYLEMENAILSNYENSVYDTLSRFILSKKEFENKNYEQAKVHLEEILSINTNKTYNSLAIIKISKISVQQEKYDEALEYLEKVQLKDAFKQIISELKGDIYKFKGDSQNSLKFYNEAISSSAINNENLLMKKNSVEK